DLADPPDRKRGLGGREVRARRRRGLRGGAVLRRQHDHAGDLGDVGGRGHQDDLLLDGQLRDPDHGDDHRRHVHDPAPRGWIDRTRVRAGHARLVHDHRHARNPRNLDPPGGPEGAVARLYLLFHSGSTGFFSLSSVVLAITGCEALYADMGHFGRPAITRAWLLLVFPACILCYL